MNDKRENEAILTPPCPADVNTDTNAANGCIIPLTNPLQPCSDANNLVEIAVENQPQNDMNFRSPIVRKVSLRARRQKLRRARMTQSQNYCRNPMKRRQLLDLQPPHPLLPIFHHQHPYDNHHHHLRYEHALLHPPMFIPQHNYNHLPRQPSPQLRQSHIHFPLLSPPPLPHQPHTLLRHPPPLHISEREFVRSKKRMLQKESARLRVKSGKDCNRDNQHLTEEPSYGSCIGKEKEGLQCLQTITNDKREREAIFLPPSPDDVKTATVDANGCIIPLTSPLQPCSDANNLVKIAVENQPQNNSNFHSPIVRKASRSAIRKKLKRAKMKLLQKTSVQMSKDSGDVINTSNDCIISSPASSQRANNDSGEISVKNQSRKDMNSHSPIMCVSRSGRPKKSEKAKIRLLQKTSLQMKVDSGHANDCIIPSVSPQPHSCSKDIGEFTVKNQHRKHRNLDIPIFIGSHGKKRKAKKKISHETGMMLINDSGDITSMSDCIIPSAPVQPCSGANGSGEISVKNQLQKDTKLHSPTVNRSHSTRRKKWKARNKPLHETSIVSEKAGSNCGSCKPIVPNLKGTRSCSATLSPSPYVANSVMPECFPMLETSAEDAKVQHYVHCTFLAKVSARYGGSLGFNQHGSDVHKVVSNEVPVVFDTGKSKIESVDQYANLGTDRVVDDNSEHPLHNGPSVVDYFLEGINIAGSSQGIHASPECENALSLKPDSRIISGVGSAEANTKDIFLRELDTPQVVRSEVNISSEATIAVSSKIRKLKCFKCGEHGHISSLCPKVKAANNAVSSKKRKRICYECREPGHISSMCPKVKAANNTMSSKKRKRICYECRERGHTSSMCPKIKADDSTDPYKEKGELKGCTHLKLDAMQKR